MYKEVTGAGVSNMSMDGWRRLFLIWIIFFSFSTCAALLFQKLILPMFPAWHGGAGLLSGDSFIFHQAAQRLAELIHTGGWQQWHAWPDAYSSGNVAVLGALYAMFGDNPLLVLPLNAAMHALTGVLLVACGWLLSSSPAARKASVVVGALYVCFPSSLNWYAQLHKDSYANLGYLMSFAALLLVIRGRLWKSWGYALVLFMSGVALIGFVRPQYLTPFIAMILAATIPLFLLVLRELVGDKHADTVSNRQRLLMFLIAIVCAAGFSKGIGSAGEFSGKLEKLDRYVDQTSSASDEFAGRPIPPWGPSAWLYSAVDERLRAIAGMRMGMLFYGSQTSAGSTIDRDIRFSSAGDVIGYVPRALSVALGAPFPSQWRDKPSLTKLVGIAEIACWYLLIPGVFLFFWRRPGVGAWCLLFASLFMLLLLGLVNPNLGTLHRVRYPFLFICMLFGALGWAQTLSRPSKHRLHRSRPKGEQEKDADTAQEALQASPVALAIEPIAGEKSAMMRMGLWVLFISLMGFGGLFLRDVVMARVFGLGLELDAIQVGSVLPTFFASLIFVPLTGAVIPELIRLQHAGHATMEKWLREIIGTALLAGIVACLLCMGLWWLQSRFSTHPAHADAVFLIWLIVLLLSGWVTIGNAMLNISGAQRIAAIGQALVPWPAIIFLFFAQAHDGAILVAFGMMIGQMLNLAYVVRGARRAKVHLWPSFSAFPALRKNFIFSYLSVMGTNFLFVAAIPLGTTLAMQLGEGHAGAFALGYKLVSLVYAVALGVTTAVLLPYFSKHLVAGDVRRARNALARLLHASLLITVPVTIVLFGFAEQIVTLLFNGGRFSAEDAQVVARVVEFGCLQLPFMIANLLIVRFAEASSKALQALIVTLLAQAVTVAAALLGLNRFGVAGIALAGSVGVIVATVFFLFLLMRSKVLSWLDGGVSLIGWWLFLTLCMCLHFASFVGALTAGFAFIMLISVELIPGWLQSRAGTCVEGQS